MCKWPIHGVCVGKHLEESPLGRDIVCFDCAEAESNYEDNKEEEDGDHAEVVTASVGDATYILKSLMVWQPGEKCSYKKNRGYKCIHDNSNADEVVLCSSNGCTSKSHLVCYSNFLDEQCSNLIYIFIFYFISISSYFFIYLETTNKDRLYEKDVLQLTCSESCYNVVKVMSKVVIGSKKDATTGVKWHNDGVGINSLALLLQWLTTEGNYNSY